MTDTPSLHAQPSSDSLVLRFLAPQSVAPSAEHQKQPVTGADAADGAPAAGQRRDGKAARRYGAFGEFKTVSQWAEDSRCQVSRRTLSRRVASGMSVEKAMSTAPRANVEVLTLTAYGESKSLREWAADARCRVPFTTLEHRIYRYNWGIVDALETARNENPALSERYDAFGEVRALSEWARDPRCLVPADRLRARVRDNGWDLAEAMATPPGQGDKQRREKVHFTTEQVRTAVDLFTQGASLQHVADRLGVTPNTLRRHAKRHYPHLHAAIEKAAVRNTLTQERARKLRAAWNAGMPETRIALAMDVGRKVILRWASTLGLPKRQLHTRRLVTAFGDTKTVTEWSKDPRCVVTAPTLRERIVNCGWRPEIAIATPPGRRTKQP